MNEGYWGNCTIIDKRRKKIENLKLREIEPEVEEEEKKREKDKGKGRELIKIDL